MLERAYLDYVEDCVVVSRGRDTDEAIEGAIKVAEEFVMEYSKDLILDESRKVKASYVHRGTETCEIYGWSWNIDSHWVSNEPVWLVYVTNKE